MFDNKWGLTQEEIEIINGEESDELSSNPVPKLRLRAIRRSHRQRKIAQARQVLRSMFGEDKVQHAPLWADNLQKCSCHMCCNPRRNDFVKGKDKLTISEQKAQLSANEQIRDLFFGGEE